MRASERAIVVPACGRCGRPIYVGRPYVMVGPGVFAHRGPCRTVPPAHKALCENCGEAIVCYPQGHWIGTDSDTRQCTGLPAGVVHWPSSIRPSRGGAA